MLKVLLVVSLALELADCNKESAPQEPPRPAPIISSSVVNPPSLDASRMRAQAVEETPEIPQGSTIEIRNNEPISLRTAEAGGIFPGVVARDVMDSKGVVEIPRGSEATLVVLGAASQRFLDIGAVSVHGHRYGLEGGMKEDASAKDGQIAAGTLLNFRLQTPAQIREIK
ncbi:MAG TPA: hypothetical protein VG273_18400 [Bryobacteraceae bacterium]|jgi:hypothetical protein|nr:hypothetical protein [Bryobacteraceae bacterium]